MEVTYSSITPMKASTGFSLATSSRSTPRITVSSARLGTRSAASLPPAAISSVSCALLHTFRASGSLMSAASFSRPGSSLGRKGAAAAGSSTSLHMLSMMIAVLRLMAVWRSRRPRSSSGTMMASAGSSTCASHAIP